jgi:hypothetical protein
MLDIQYWEYSYKNVRVKDIIYRRFKGKIVLNK